MVPLLGEPDETIEDGLGPLHSRLGSAEHDLIAPHDDLALDELLDPPENRVPVPEDLESPPRRNDELDFYLVAGSGFRVFSFYRFQGLLQPVSGEGGELAAFGAAFGELRGTLHDGAHVSHTGGAGVVYCLVY